jgi:hypothetical protein
MLAEYNGPHTAKATVPRHGLRALHIEQGVRFHTRADAPKSSLCFSRAVSWGCVSQKRQLMGGLYATLDKRKCLLDTQVYSRAAFIQAEGATGQIIQSNIVLNM